MLFVLELTRKMYTVGLYQKAKSHIGLAIIFVNTTKYCHPQYDRALVNLQSQSIEM